MAPRFPGAAPMSALLALGLAGALAAAGCGRGAIKRASSDTAGYTTAELGTVDPGASLGGTPAPGFTLTDQFGQQVSLAQFRGKVVVLSFDDDECTNICPLTGATMVEALQLLGPAASHVQLLGVNANPDHTAVADVAAFSRTHGLMNKWLFLTGPAAQLKQVWAAYGIEDQVVHGSVDHTPALYVLDEHGGEQRLFLTSAAYGVVPVEAATLAQAIAGALPGHPTVAKAPNPTGGAIASPADAVTLAPLVAGGAPLTLGGGSSRLLAFFDSWAPNAAQALTALNAYARQGLPPLAAVDVAPTEPSLSAPRALAPIQGGTLRYPVLVDPSGRVADAYGVQDIPWLVLVAGGKILWSHDGWLPAATLRRQVAAALAAPAKSSAAASSG